MNLVILIDTSDDKDTRCVKNDSVRNDCGEK